MAKRDGSTISALSLSVIGTTCCALPAALVALGAGGAVASLASNAPWLIALSQYKGWTFGVTAAALGYAWWQSRRVGECSIADAKRLKLQQRILLVATALLGVSVFVAYALLPITAWFDRA
jgi:ABC-type sugar transport system substrate-binding protein